ncbi:MAG: SDR family oxidoreductase [Planctomycetes bacterium]|nr:SDR family oxidoreductase [Planctomycetota bacterium]
MDTAERTRQIVFRVIKEMNREFPEDQGLDQSPSAILYGKEASLDSQGLVDLVLRIQECVVLITGSRTGIGRSLAERYLEKGAQVVGCSRGACDIDSQTYCHFSLDLAEETDVRKMFADVRRRYGRLDVLINNAGMLVTAPAMLTSGQTVRDVVGVNFLGMLLCCREAAAVMKKGGSGRIVNLTSIAVPLASVGNSVYSASKAAVEQFTRVFAKEVYSFGITVNALGLPPVENTGMGAALPEGAIADTLERIAVKRMVTVEEVAHAVDFLAAEQSGAITGQTLYLGGP